MRIRDRIVLGVVLSAQSLFSQGLGVVRGLVLDFETNKPVPNVNVIVRGEKKIGTSTDSTGWFRLELPVQKRQLLVFSRIGYGKVVRELFVETKTDPPIRLYLQPEPVTLGEVVITAEKKYALSQADLKRALYAVGGDEFERLGEPDMDKAMQYMFPDIVKSQLARVSRNTDDFTLYVDGEWKETLMLDEINPFSIKRVVIWGGPFKKQPGAFSPIGFPLIRGSRYVILIETR